MKINKPKQNHEPRPPTGARLITDLRCLTLKNNSTQPKSLSTDYWATPPQPLYGLKNNTILDIFVGLWQCLFTKLLFEWWNLCCYSKWSAVVSLCRRVHWKQLFSEYWRVCCTSLPQQWNLHWPGTGALSLLEGSWMTARKSWGWETFRLISISLW